MPGRGEDKAHLHKTVGNSRGYKGEPFAQKDFGTMNNSNLEINMKKKHVPCLEIQPVQDRRTGC